MHERLKSLQQLLRVYEAVEKIHEADSAQAAIEVREVEQAIGRESRVSRAVLEYERQAVLEGDRLGCSVAVVQQKAVVLRQARLAGVLSEREARSYAAQQQHMDSRQWSERVQKLIDRIADSVARVEEKRQQMNADDRFLSRSRWKQRSQLEDRAGG